MMLEAIFGAGYDMQLVRDLWRILFADWTEAEAKFLALFLMLMFGAKMRQMF